jgi:hypothetical protein
MSKIFAGLKFVLLLVVCFVVLLSCASPLLAQTSGTGALTGTVTDPSGAVIAGATVIATNAGTGLQRTATTDSSGGYQFSLLPPGTYNVKFSASGFKTSEVQRFPVNVTESAVLNSKLEIGAQGQEVTVTGEAPVIETASSALGTIVGSAMMTDLPLASRNYTNLLSLSAGANASVTNAASLGQGTQETSTNGSAATQNNFQMDGVAIDSYVGTGLAEDTSTRASFGIPNPDTIQEFKIQTSTYDAGYGRNPGANVNIITKSGTNQFHGTAFEFLRNTVLNANDWMANSTNSPRGALSQNQFGGTIGGPVKKDKLFFFASYQETGQKNGLSPFGLANYQGFALPLGNRGTCPAGATSLSACDAATQTFLGELGTLNTCAVTSLNPLGNCYAAGAGPFNIGANGLGASPVAIQILQLKLPNGAYYIPSPNGASTAPGVSCNASLFCSSSGTGLFHEYQGMGNWDYMINGKNTLSGRYFGSAQSLISPYGSPGNISLPGTPGMPNYNNDEAVLRLTSTVTNNMVNEVRLSYQLNQGISTEGEPFSDTQVGMTPVESDFDHLASIGIGNMTIGTPIFTTFVNQSNQYQLADQVSWVHGKNSMRFGFEGGWIRWKFYYTGLSDGFLIMAGPGGFLQGTAGDIVAEPSFVTRYGQPGGGNDYTEHSYSWFVQDDIKVTSRLTVNLGLRWEWDGFPIGINGKNPNINPLLMKGIVPNIGELTSCPPYPTACPGSSFVGFTMPANWPSPVPAGVTVTSGNALPVNSSPLTNFAPRVGFAWQPLASNKLVLRGGAGYFYDLIGGENFAHGTQQAAPYAETLGGVNAATGTLQLPYITTPANWVPLWVTASGGSSNIAQSGVGPYMPTPVTYSWNLNTQYEFLHDWSLEVGYVGSRGIHQVVSGQIINAAMLTNAAITGAAPSPSNAALRVPYLGMETTFGEYSDSTDSKFNSLQATVRKRFSHGLNLQANYTWSRAFLSNWVGNPNITQASQTGSPIISQYGLSPWYRPNRFTLQYSYTFPSGHLTGVAGMLASGWVWSGETTIQDGQPLSIQDQSLGSIFGLNVANPSAGVSQAEFCPGMGPANAGSSGSVEQRVANSAHGGWFNPAAFADALGSGCAAGSSLVPIDGGTGFGNSGQGIVLGPPQNNWDMALMKNTKFKYLGESGAIQFRTEFFNAFNHPQFSNPGSLSGPGSGAQFNVGNSAFGDINTMAVNPRLIQFGLKLLF